MSVVRSLKLRKLLTHKRNDRINTTKNGFEIDRGKKHFPGLTVVLKRRYKMFRNQPNNSTRRRQTAGNVHRRNTGCRGMNDRDHGTIVDNQITELVNSGVLRRTHPKDYATLRVGDVHVDPCVVRLLLQFHKHGWIPVACQVAIFSEDLKISTAMDIVCEDKAGKKFILVELKTSTDSEPSPYEKPLMGRYLANPMQSVPASQKNRDMLQLLAMDCILDKAYKCKPDESHLIRIRSSDIDDYPLVNSPWTDKLRQRFYVSLKNSGYRK